MKATNNVKTICLAKGQESPYGLERGNLETLQNPAVVYRAPQSQPGVEKELKKQSWAKTSG